jgi:hypothetical protein
MELFLSHIEERTRKMPLDTLLQFNRYVDTYLVHMIEKEPLQQVRKIIRVRESQLHFHT